MTGGRNVWLRPRTTRIRSSIAGSAISSSAGPLFGCSGISTRVPRRPDCTTFEIAGGDQRSHVC